MDVDHYAMTTDSELDIVEEPTETTEAVQSDVLRRCTGSLELLLDVVGLGCLEKNVVASDSQNPVADVALLVAAFVEALDFIALEKAKDVLRYVVGGISSGRAGINPDPYNDGTRDVINKKSPYQGCPKNIHITKGVPELQWTTRVGSFRSGSGS